MSSPFCVFRNAEAYVVNSDPPAAPLNSESYASATIRHDAMKLHAKNSADNQISMNKNFLADIQVSSSLLRETIYEDTLSTAYNIRNNGESPILPSF